MRFSVHLIVQKGSMQAVSVRQLKSNMKKYLDDVSISSNVIVVSRALENEAVVIINERI